MIHVQLFDPDGNSLTVVSDASGRVHIVIEHDELRPRRSNQATIASDQLVLVAYEMLRLVQDAEGSDAVDGAIAALKPYADERDRLAHLADALWAPSGDES